MIKLIRLFLLAAFAVLPACNTVEFYEKAAFQDPVMDLGGSGTESHFHQKVFYSMEGSAGGIGSTAGGGCGCY